MPNTTVATNDVLSASFFNTNYRDQVISTVTSATRPSGTEGQVIYETDTDRFYYYNGGWVEFFKTGAWNTYTPTLTQSGAVTKTASYVSYQKMGRRVRGAMRLDVTGAGTANNAINISLPVATVGAMVSVACGTGWVYDATTSIIYPALIEIATTTTAIFRDTTVAVAAGNSLGQSTTTFGLALASGDAVSASFEYESAT